MTKPIQQPDRSIILIEIQVKLIFSLIVMHQAHENKISWLSEKI